MDETLDHVFLLDVCVWECAAKHAQGQSQVLLKPIHDSEDTEEVRHRNRP